jgi:hypothetical protein
VLHPRTHLDGFSFTAVLNRHAGFSVVRFLKQRPVWRLRGGAMAARTERNMYSVERQSHPFYCTCPKNDNGSSLSLEIALWHGQPGPHRNCHDAKPHESIHLAWLEELFIKNRKTLAMILDAEFHTFVQGDLSTSEYCLRLKNMADALGSMCWMLLSYGEPPQAASPPSIVCRDPQ